MSDAKRVEVPDESLFLGLGDLSEKQRFVVECYFGFRDDRTYTTEDIAALMGITRQAVESLLARALATLERVLAGCVVRIDREPPSAEEIARAEMAELMGCPEQAEAVNLSPYIPMHHGHDDVFVPIWGSDTPEDDQ